MVTVIMQICVCEEKIQLRPMTCQNGDVLDWNNCEDEWFKCRGLSSSYTTATETFTSFTDETINYAPPTG